MSTIWLKRFLLLAFVSAACSATHAQEIVHAVSGVATAVDPAHNTITLKTNDGSEGVFKYQVPLKTEIVFDKNVREGTIQPDGFNKIGDHVVAYYFGLESLDRTVVALKDFGPSALEVASGTVVKSGRHAITIKTDSGATVSFEIARDASAETPSGVVTGSRFEADQGTRVTIRYTETNGIKTAHFIRNAFG